MRVRPMSEQKQIQLLPEGFIACPYCNHDNQIQLVDVFTRVDKKVDPDGVLPNVYLVSLLKCQCCDETFELERVDVRFGSSTPSPTPITEIDFQNEFVVYTTLSLEEAVKKAVKWYNDRFDYPLGKPLTRVVGTTIYTRDPRVIDVPEESE
jgi:transcription elongation factor Elf1